MDEGWKNLKLQCGDPNNGFHLLVSPDLKDKFKEEEFIQSIGISLTAMDCPTGQRIKVFKTPLSDGSEGISMSWEDPFPESNDLDFKSPPKKKPTRSDDDSSEICHKMTSLSPYQIAKYSYDDSGISGNRAGVATSNVDDDDLLDGIVPIKFSEDHHSVISSRADVMSERSVITEVPADSTGGAIYTPAPNHSETSEFEQIVQTVEAAGYSWTDDAISKLLKECITIKRNLSTATRLSATVWKKIATELNKKGVLANFEQCRAKKKRMDCVFRKKVLKECDKRFILEYQFMKEMCELHDVPIKNITGDVVSSSSNSTKSINSSNDVGDILHEADCGDFTDRVDNNFEGNCGFNGIQGTSSEPKTGEGVFRPSNIGSATDAVDTHSEAPTPSFVRAVGKAGAVWTMESTAALTTLCTRFATYPTHNEHFSNSPPATWRAVSDELRSFGYNYSWEQVREKILNLEAFYQGTLVKAQGFIHGQFYPHYLDLCRIFGFAKKTAVGEVAPADSNKWTVEETLLLLEEYKQRKRLFDGEAGAIVHDRIYDEISATMTQYGVNKSAAKCRNKMDQLKCEFREHYDMSLHTGQEPTTWRYYHLMLEMSDNCVGLTPAFAFSTGRTSSFKVHGEEDRSVVRYSRSKSNAKKKEPAQSRQIKESHQERQYQLHCSLLQEMSAMRKAFEGVIASRRQEYQ